MTHCQSDPDSNAIFRWHFQRYAAARRQSRFDATETETRPGELIAFAKHRFDGLITLFAASFFDSSDAIQGFLPTARRAMRPESTAAE
jgi:hypothetical protein